MKTKLLKIINHYGVYSQTLMFVEETSEFIKALCKMQRDDQDLKAVKENMEEEMADVCVMLMQFANYYKLDVAKITQIMWEKVDKKANEVENERNN